MRPRQVTRAQCVKCVHGNSPLVNSNKILYTFYFLERLHSTFQKLQRSADRTLAMHNQKRMAQGLILYK